MKTEWYGLFRSDNCNPVGTGSVTSRYTPHQTDDVIALVEAAQEAFEGEVSVKCHFRDGHFVAVEPTKIIDGQFLVLKTTFSHGC
jgi:hypothetical protein